MPIKKETVAAVVAEASQRMSEPNYSASLVGGFVQAQPSVVQYVSAHEDELGGAEGVVNVIFHAALIGQAFQRGNGGRTRTLSFDDLDRAAGGDSMELLSAAQPFVHGFIEENVAAPVARSILALVSLALDR
ncbi:MAG TPA: hypothetical protein VHE35_35090 [Kofleriaceae bacterium]|nr:hypothetical protein [Kofleriaceae bacterium]